MTEKEKNYFTMKGQHIDQYEEVLTESSEQSEKPHSIFETMLIEEDQED